MVSRVLYRPFDTEDFDAIALILQQLWHNNSDNDEYNRLEAAWHFARACGTELRRHYQRALDGYRTRAAIADA